MLHPYCCCSSRYRISFDGSMKRTILSCVRRNCSCMQLEHSDRKRYPHITEKFLVERCALFSMFSPATGQTFEVSSLKSWGSCSYEIFFFSQFLPQSQYLFSFLLPKASFCWVGFLGSWKELRSSLDSFGNDVFVPLVLYSPNHPFCYGISIFKSWSHKLFAFWFAHLNWWGVSRLHRLVFLGSGIGMRLDYIPLFEGRVLWLVL